MEHVAISLEHAENARLLREDLADRHDVHVVRGRDDVPGTVDLWIVDGVSLGQHRDLIARARDAEHPVYLPVLLVLGRRDVTIADRELWRMVDDLLWMPIEKVEIRARVEVLLRARRLSLELARREARAAELARVTNTRLQELLNSLDIGVFRGRPGGPVVEANPAILRIFGAGSVDELPQLGGDSICPPLAHFSSEGPCASSSETTVTRTFRQGDTWLALRVRLGTDLAGEFCVDGFVTDVTQEIRMEEALRRAEEDLRNSRRLESFARIAAGVAHDINNMLGVIVMLGKLVEDQLAADDRARAEVGELVEAAKRGAMMTQQLMGFARTPEPKASADVTEVLGVVERQLRALLPSTIALSVEGVGDRPRVRLSAGELERVIMNLALNARDAMPDGGALTIRVRQAENGAAAPTVVISVRDTGHGMDEATRARLFEPLFTTKGSRGTGLGLATVRHLVGHAGGHVTVDSAPGAGARFDVHLPVAEVAASVNGR